MRLVPENITREDGMFYTLNKRQIAFIQRPGDSTCQAVLVVDCGIELGVRVNCTHVEFLE